jgi:hypothetical protein
MDESSLSGTFSKTIVLLLKHDATSTYGLIINAPSQRRHGFPLQERLPSCFRHEDVSWRRGGPVCGGRLGLVRYIVAHTLPLLQAGEEEDGSGTNIGEAYTFCRTRKSWGISCSQAGRQNCRRLNHDIAYADFKKSDVVR